MAGNPNNPPDKGARIDQDPEQGKTVGNPLNLLLPVDRGVWAEARRLVSEKSFRVEDASTCASQDPIIVIELLRISNMMAFAADRQTISSTKSAIQRLGSQVVLETLEKIQDRPEFPNEDISHWFELHRSRCKRTAILARMIATTVAAALSEEAQAAGLLLHVGDLLAVAHFREQYVKLAEQYSRGGINYKLTHDYRFNVESVGSNYLQRNGVPEMLVSAIGRETTSRSADRATLRPICLAASDLIEAFDSDRWAKLAPGKALPPKSAVRYLSLTDAQYAKIYERASEYLFNMRTLEEKKRLVGTSSDREESVFSSPALEKPEIPEQKPERGGTPDLTDQFSLGAALNQTKSVPRIQPPLRPKIIPTLRTNNGNQVVRSIAEMFTHAETSEQLLTDLLNMLVASGPFKQAALIVVSKDRKHAIVVACRGSALGCGQRLLLEDPLSPLAQCFSRIQSFPFSETELSPFGSKSFALAPIMADHDTPVALYADCGSDATIIFEARRIFRAVVEILNERLPSIPGGIPVELPS